MRHAPTAPSEEGTMALLSPCGVVQLLATVVAVMPLHLVPAARQEEACHFPSKWEGTWFQSGVRSPIIISQNRLSTKGRCTVSEGDKFVVFDEKSCYRCVVIHEKHANVLQYKESYCRSRESLSNLCSLITGDALLYSMFRIEATPVPCPFKGPFTFTYNRGHGDCKLPVSSIDSCTEDSRLLLRYQACPDIPGTESTVEELQCLATWKEGSSRYLVGKVHHSHATSNEDRYRCFVYEKSSLPTVGGEHVVSGDGVDFRVAQSGDATCNGLFSPMEGSRTMTLKKAMSHSKCWFPLWLTSSLHWHTLDYTRSYTFHHRNTTLRISNSSLGGSHKSTPRYENTLMSGAGISVSMGLSSDSASQEMRVVCTEMKQQTAEVAHLVTHFTMGCQSGFMCMTFYRRDGHVIEVQTGSHTWRPEDACQSTNFNKSSLPFVTLVTSSPEPRQCPYLGKFSVTGLSRGGRLARSLRHEWRLPRGRGRLQRDLDGLSADVCPEESQDFTTLVVGCNTVDTMEFRSKCLPTDVVSVYSCHGRWEDNGTHYLITTPLSRSSHGARRLCFMYRELEGIVLFSSSADSCQRNISPGIGGALAFNVTSSGQCTEANGGPQPTARASWVATAGLILAAAQWRVER